MTKRERVLAAMNNQPVDRPPVGFWFHFPEEEQLNQGCIDTHLHYCNHVDTDVRWLFRLPQSGGKGSQGAGRPVQDGAPCPKSDFSRGQVARAKAVKEGLTSGCLVLYNVFAPFSSIRFGANDELVKQNAQPGIMIGADCTLPATIDPARIQWVVDTEEPRMTYIASETRYDSMQYRRCGKSGLKSDRKKPH